MNSLRLVSLLFLFIANCQQIQEQEQKPFVRIEHPISVDIEIGNKKVIELPFQVLYGYHIQADTVNDNNLIRAVLTFEQIEGIYIGTPAFPNFKKFQLNGTSEELLVFDGELIVSVPISVHQSTKKGSYSLPGDLYYQACDSIRCLFPRRIKFQVVVNVH